MKIQVTQEDIDRGVRNSSFRCPVALAVKRAFNSICVSVGTMQIYVDYKWYAIPEEVRDKIVSFDQSYTILPFEFEI